MIVDHWGKLTIGVNNAGICKWGEAEKVDIDSWQAVMRLNLDAVFIAPKRRPPMFEAEYGKIINTASMSGHIVNTPQDQVA
jgi:NAD(P)-dependent dehydrogenase (short-subunit alcohol dehydrogenase family)